MDFYGMDQPVELLTKTNVDGSKVIRKLSRNETRQMEKYKKMSKVEKMFAVKHVNCFHQCVPPILKEKMKECQCKDCDIECEYHAKGIFCLTFREHPEDSP